MKHPLFKTITLNLFCIILFSSFFYRYFHANQLFPAQVVAYIVVSILIFIFIGSFLFKNITNKFFLKNIITKIESIDFLIVLLLFFILIKLFKTLIFNDLSSFIVIYGKFCLPVFAYFIAKKYSLELQSKFTKYFIFFSLIASALVLFEGYFQIVHFTDIFNWSNDFTQTQNIYAGMPIKYTLFDIYTTRPRGWSGQPQATGSFLLVFLLFFIFHKSNNKIINFLIILFILCAIYISGSRTAIMLLPFGLLIYVFFYYKISLKLILLISCLSLVGVFIMFSFLVSFLQFDTVLSTFYYSVINYINSLMMQPGVPYVKYGDVILQDKAIKIFFNSHSSNYLDILFGQENSFYIRDIFLLNNFLRMGTFYSLILVLILINLSLQFFTNKKNDIELYVIVLFMILCSLHYDITALFPANIVLFLVIGFIQSNKIEKRFLFITK